jgi:hypothetical protein
MKYVFYKLTISYMPRESLNISLKRIFCCYYYGNNLAFGWESVLAAACCPAVGIKSGKRPQLR